MLELLIICGFVILFSLSCAVGAALSIVVFNFLVKKFYIE